MSGTRPTSLGTTQDSPLSVRRPSDQVSPIASRPRKSVTSETRGDRSDPFTVPVDSSESSHEVPTPKTSVASAVSGTPLTSLTATSSG